MSLKTGESSGKLPFTQKVKITKTSFELEAQVGLVFNEQYAIALDLGRLSHLPFTLDYRDVVAVFRTSSGEEYEKKMAFYEGSLWILEEGIPEQADELVKLKIEASFDFPDIEKLRAKGFDLLTNLYIPSTYVTDSWLSGLSLSAHSVFTVSSAITGFLEDCQDIVIPALDVWNPVSFDKEAPEDIQFEELSSSIEDIALPSLVVPAISGESQEQLTEALEDTAAALTAEISEVAQRWHQQSAFLDYRYYCYVTFSARDSWSNYPIRPDSIEIDGVPVSFDTETNGNGDLVCIVRSPVKTPYKMAINCEGYQSIFYVLRPELALPGYEFEPLDLGIVYLANISSALTYSLVWGGLPPDLDFHVWSFDEYWVQQEHVYFKNMRESGSIIALDYDDRDSYGPENVQIFKLDPKKWYLLSVHNYSWYHDGIPGEWQMNYEGLTKMTIQYYGNKLELSPYANGSSSLYWWDAYAIHDKKIYFLDTFNVGNRSPRQDFDFRKNKISLEALKKAVQNAKKTVTFEEFRNGDY